jgi:nucleoside-diphosphate-sugar epimerase
MKEIIVTGASGFIGRYAIPYLLKDRYVIHAVFFNSKPDIQHKNLIWHQCNLLKTEEQKILFSRIKPSHLLHFAWDAVPGKYWTSLENLRWVQTSIELLKNFKKNGGIRAVFAGTCAEYDWNYGYCSEGVTPMRSSTLYGICKNSLQEIITQFSKQTGLDTAWGRIFYLYGPFEERSRLIPYVINSLLLNQQTKLTHGNQIRDFLYVQDVASAFVALLNSEVQGPVNIASGQPVALQQIVYTIANKLEKRDLVKLGAIQSPEDEPPLLLANVRRLIQEVEWLPRFSLNEGLEATIEWWKNQRKVE